MRKSFDTLAALVIDVVACRLFSLMLSCKQNGVNPEAYTTDVLMAVATTSSADIAELTPWAWGERKRLAAAAD